MSQFSVTFNARILGKINAAAFQPYFVAYVTQQKGIRRNAVSDISRTDTTPIRYQRDIQLVGLDSILSLKVHNFIFRFGRKTAQNYIPVDRLYMKCCLVTATLLLANMVIYFIYVRSKLFSRRK